jgi:prophage regulatory protein
MGISFNWIQVAGGVIRLHELEKLTGRKRSSVYEDMAAGRLPKPIKIGPRAVGWLRSDIDKWLAGRVAERDQEVVA